jgi:hypothetical protein
MTYKIETLSGAELTRTTEAIWSEVMCLRRELHLLMHDLESGLDEDRGSVDGENVTLSFNQEGIDATVWLAGQAWKRASQLAQQLDGLVDNSPAPSMGEAA